MDKNKKKFMDLALRLALKAKGLTSPNPLVGAVIEKNNRIISTGYHKRAGLAHAEATALKKAGKRARGANLYVTLEPCSTTGRTPPCTDAIIRNKIKNVFVSMADPNPKHKGRGLNILKENNIKVNIGMLKDSARMINQPFIKSITKNLPYVTLKIAESIDGKIATFSGYSKWITSTQSRNFSRKLRNRVDAIMVGVNTVLQDNPSLSPQRFIKSKKYYKIILDTQLRLTGKERIFSDSEKSPVIIATSKEAFHKSSSKKDYLISKNSIILVVKRNGKFLDLKDLLKKLIYFDITNILLEGGAEVSGSFIDEDLVDRVIFFIAPKIIGGANALSGIRGEGIKKLSQAKKLKDLQLNRIGQDIYIEGLIHKY